MRSDVKVQRDQLSRRSDSIIYVVPANRGDWGFFRVTVSNEENSDSIFTITAQYSPPCSVVIAGGGICGGADSVDPVDTGWG